MASNALPPVLPSVWSASSIQLEAGWRMAMHSHEEHHELVLVTSGRVQTDYSDGRSIVTGPGGIKFHRNRIGHDERLLDGKRGGLVFATWKEAPGASLESMPISTSDRTGRMRMLLDWMVELCSAQDRERDVNLAALMHALLLEYAAAGSGPPDPMVVEVRAWIRDHLAQPIYLDDLARVAAMSRFHFARLFLKATGRSPMQYVRRMRVEAARTLLLATEQPLRSIAPRVGFADEFQLSRAFRQITGQPPGSLRQSRRRSNMVAEPEP